MSLLADLLSKNKSAAEGEEKNPTTLDIPPTLSKAHEFPAKVPRHSYRYVVITVLLMASLAVGILMTTKYRSSSFPPGPKTVSGPAPQDASFRKADQVPGQPLQKGAAPAGQPVGESNVARINLGQTAAAPVPEKKPGAPEVASPRPAPQQRRIQAAAPPAASAAPTGMREAQRRSAPGQTKPVAPQRIDTAARDALLYAARSAEQSSDWKSALASYRKAQEIDPGNYKIMSNVAAAYNNLGLFDDGVLEAERALGKKPDYVPALINAAVGYSSKGNTQKALRLFSYASALDPGNRSLTINLGILQERSGNLDEAQATYRQLAKAGDPLALQGMARIYERKHNKGEAASSYRQILKSPNASPALKKEARGELERLQE